MILLVSVCLWILLERYEMCLYFYSFVVYIYTFFFTYVTFFFIVLNEICNSLISYRRAYFYFSIMSTFSLTASRPSISIFLGFHILLCNVDSGLLLCSSASRWLRFSNMILFFYLLVLQSLLISDSIFLSS